MAKENKDNHSFISSHPLSFFLSSFGKDREREGTTAKLATAQTQ